MFEIQSFSGLFLDRYGNLYRYHPEKGYLKKKMLQKRGMFGYKINHNFVTLKKLRSLIIHPSEEPYIVPF
jgi:hypothetical protein